MTESAVRIGLVLPDVMGTYGDSGNSVVLRERPSGSIRRKTLWGSLWCRACPTSRASRTSLRC